STVQRIHTHAALAPRRSRMTRMRDGSRVRQAALVALAVAAWIVPRSDKAQTGAPQGGAATGGVLSGVVRGSVGSPGAGGRVSVGAAAAVTDSSGAFVVRGL